MTRQSTNVAVSTDSKIVPSCDLRYVKNNNIIAMQVNDQPANYSESVGIPDNSNGDYESMENKISPDSGQLSEKRAHCYVFDN